VRCMYVTAFASDKCHRINKQTETCEEIRLWPCRKDYKTSGFFFNFINRRQETVKQFATIMQELANSNAPNHILDTLDQVNGLRINTKNYSIADTSKHVSLKSFRLPRTLFGDSLLVTILILGLVLGSIQSKNPDQCTEFRFLCDKSILSSIPLRKVDSTIHASIEWLIFKNTTFE
jgi:hypothetical protein